MPTNIRQRIARAIQRTLRKTSRRPVKKPAVLYELKQTSRNDDYIDLSECYSKDSGISIELNQPFESTKLYSDDSSTFSIYSNLSAISHMDLQRVECCRCQCHHYVNKKQLFGGRNRYELKVYPFIF